MPHRSPLPVVVGLGLSLAAAVSTVTWIACAPAEAQGVIVQSTPPLTPATVAASDSGIVTGNPQGDVTLVEVFDYQCPVCRQVHPDVMRLVTEDGNIRLVHKHWPILGAASVHAAELALAARWQDRYDAVHTALMGQRGKLTRQSVREAAAAAGLDLARADADLTARRDEIDTILAGAAREATIMGLRGTPAFLVGNYVVPGGLAHDDLAELVRLVRAGADGG
ncbi:DsbA family protein [Caenispirillum bisanense]|uniref:DsbA family protein n=1 Tax=Caenispirillum bisanense TaxID=414052 RepID=UPI0031D28E45